MAAAKKNPAAAVASKKKKEEAVVEETKEEEVAVREDAKKAVDAIEEEEHGYSDLDDDELLEIALQTPGVPETSQKKKKTSKEGSEARKRRTPSKSNVLYLGHVPQGFHENEMKRFLDQFGKLTNVRVSRSKRTGNSRGYAFLQFQSAEVADIVQKTLHGYILLGRSLVCQHVPEENVYDNMFYGGLSGFSKKEHVNKLEGARKKRVLALIQRGEEESSDEAKAKRARRLAKTSAARMNKLAEKGISYAVSGGYADQATKA